MAQFKILSSNFKISTMVEHGTLAFFLNGERIIAARDSIDSKNMVLAPGKYEYQWQVNGTDGLTHYSIRLMLDGKGVPKTGVGPRVLNGGDTDFGGGIINVDGK